MLKNVRPKTIQFEFTDNTQHKKMKYLTSGLVSQQHRKGVDLEQLGMMIIVKTKRREMREEV